MIQLVELTGASEDLDAVERHLLRRHGTREITVVAVSPTRRFVRAVSAVPEGCRRAFEAGAACLTCQLVTADGAERTDHWTIMLPGTRRALRLVGRTRPRTGSPASRLLGVRRFVPRRNPTPRQAAAIEAAYRLGYYSFPRRTGLRELARRLSVSRSTASELLRRAEGAMLARELDTSRS
jgi:predicted DNA binding protein